MRKRRRSVVVFIAILLCICTSVHATILNLKSLQLTRPALTTFFTYASNSGSMNLPSNMGVGATVSSLVGLPGNNGYTISSGATLTMSSSALDHDTSSGGLASGEFNGGGTLTLTGTLNYNGNIIATGNLLVANMAISSSETWTLQELSGSPIVCSGSVQYIPDATQGLGLGISNGLGDILKIGNFRVDFSFNNVAPNPSVFNTNETLKGFSNVIKFESMPEPATIFLFTIAALAFRINKKR
jgi:hypothetical protein